MNKNKFFKKITNFFTRPKKLNDDDLKKVSGSINEPEEFGWKTNGYVTPVKEEPKNVDWAFRQIGNKDILKK